MTKCDMPVGSDPTAAGGREREGSEWQRSIKSSILRDVMILSGTATGMSRTPVQKLVSYSTVTNLASSSPVVRSGILLKFIYFGLDGGDSIRCASWHIGNKSG